jgi:desulfoferrodoxin (superoxide reductase-like protein)
LRFALIPQEQEPEEIMTRREFLTTSTAAVGAVLVTTGPAWANQAESKIEVPPSAPINSEITIKITVNHSANSFFHYTEWAWIQVNGKEIARWDFSSGNRPESETFSREAKIRVDGNLDIRAKASCNLHGSANEAVGTIKML